MIGFSNRKAFRSALLSTVAISVPMIAFPQGVAYAQNQASEGTESVVVTSSRIVRSGFSAPTPVTVVGAADLAKSATTTIADALNQLPQFGAGTSNHAGFQGGNNGGVNYINLRNLGATRTLILLNGERVVSSSLTNAIDLNTLPNALIQRVDVVTGGASAAWGSDAVAGVVNMVLNTNFEGLKGSAQYSNNRDNAYEGYKAELSFGTGFDGGKGHVLASVSYFDNPQFYLLKQTQWNNGSALVLNPAFTATNGQPQYIHANHIGQAQQSQGGVIIAGPLKNTLFVGPNATPTIYNPGNVSGVISNGGNADESFLSNTPVGLPQHGFNFFTYGSYELTPDIKAHVEYDYGVDGGRSAVGPYQRAGNVVITSDNPYIPAQTLAQMNALKLTSFSLGTNNINLGYPGNGGTVYPNNRVLQRFAAGLDGNLGGGWTWKAYYTHGETHTTERWLNDVYIPYYNLAVDAVAAPAGNAAGIAPGTVVCRSTLTSPTNGCKPLNLFGIGTASPEAIKYVTPIPYTVVNNKQDVAAISAQGEPFSDWAGPISVAAGAEYRSESAISYSDALTYTRQFAYGNALPFHGAVNVYEGYLETIVPLARNEWWAQSMDFNGAGRITDYSTSGVVETWKLGLTDQVTDELRLRVTWSNDIRAPNLSELFTQAVSGGRAIADPFNPGQTPNVLATTKGNPNLNPEVATTVSGGIVLTPGWLPGFQASFDWYSINIKGAISTVSAENELAYCFAGQSVYCPFIIRNPSGVIVEIDSVPANTAFESTSGLDIEAEYSHELWDGTADLRLLANYTDEHTTTQNNQITNNAGSLANTVGGNGEPKFKAVLTATYNWGSFSGTVQGRYIGEGTLLHTWTNLNVDSNYVPAVAYLDLRGSYDIDDHVQAFFAIDNTLNTPPANVVGLYNAPSVYYTPGPPGTIYDLFGRQYRVGLRANF